MFKITHCTALVTLLMQLLQTNEILYVKKKVHSIAKFSPKVCSRLTTKVADLVVPARFLVILFLMQFVLRIDNRRHSMLSVILLYSLDIVSTLICYI